MAGDFISAAASVKAESSQFEQTFGALQESAADAIGRVAENADILETRLNTLGSQIYAFARSSGGDTEESMALMETALQAAADGAAYYDKSLEDVTATLQSFLKGNFENDAALGVSATETTRNAAAMELFGEKYADLTEIQKQQTLLKMVTDAQALSGAMGQAAREADGWENVQGNLSEAWRQFIAHVGAPTLENLVPIIQNVTAGLSEWTASVDWNAFSGTVTVFFNTIIENGPTIISSVAGIGAAFVTWNVASMINGVVTAIKTFKAANEGATVAQALLNGVMNANPFMLVATLIAGVVTALVVLWNTNEDFRNAVIEIWDNIKTTFVSAWEAIVGFFSNAWDAVKEIWNGSRVQQYFSLLWETIEAVFSVVESVLAGDFEGAWEAIKSIVGGWKAYFAGVWNDIKSVFSNAWQAFKSIGGDIVNGIKQGISNAWSTLTSTVNSKITNLVSGVKSLLKINSPSKVFADIGGYMAQGLGEGWESDYASVKRTIESGMKFDTATVDFASSGIARSNAGIGAAISGAVANAGENMTIIVQSVLDGKVIGETAYKYSHNRQKAYGGAY